MKKGKRPTRKQTEGTRRRKWRAWVLLSAIIPIALTGYLLTDWAGNPYGFLGLSLWVLALLASFFVGLIYYACFVLPLPGGIESWYEGLRSIAIYYFLSWPRSIWRLLLWSGSPTAASRARGKLSPSMRELRAGMIESHTALVITRLNAFIRAAGPGFVRLNRRETISDFIDLRRHLYKQPVRAMSKDGIRLDTVVSVILQVRQREVRENEPVSLYPYESDAVRQLIDPANISRGAGFEFWGEHLCRQAADQLTMELTRYDLDDLFAVGEDNVHPLEIIKNKVKDSLSPQAAECGLTLIGVGVAPFEMPPDVRRQRLENWQTTWQRDIVRQLADGDSQAMRRMRHARARAQIEIIENITGSIETMRDSGEDDLREVIALRMIEMMDRWAADDTVRSMVPQDVIMTLRQMQTWLTKGDK